MVFNDIVGGTGVCQEIDDLCQTDLNSYPLTSKARRVNAALDRFFTLAFTADGRWSFDDSTRADLPVATTDIISGQQDYGLDLDMIILKNVLVKGSTGTWSELLKENTTDENWGASGSGEPLHYALVGNSILLGDTPNYFSQDGLKIVFQRNKLEMVATYTTTPLGIPSLFNQYIARYAALPHLIEMQRPSKNDIASQIQIDEQAILNYYNNRLKGVKRRLTVLPRHEQ